MKMAKEITSYHDIYNLLGSLYGYDENTELIGKANCTQKQALRTVSDIDRTWRVVLHLSNK